MEVQKWEMKIFSENQKKLVGNKTKIMSVIKANAYGHGAVKVAETLVESGIERSMI